MLTYPCCDDRDGTMSAEDFEVLRQHMLAEISAETFHVSDLIVIAHPLRRVDSGGVKWVPLEARI